MKQYLLSVYQPEGEPPPEVLEAAMRDVDLLNEEVKAAGAWIFAGGSIRQARRRCSACRTVISS